MLVELVVTALLGGQLDLAGTSEPSTVSGGVADLDDEFPAVVRLRPHVGLCSGVLVSDSLVLTAAHCLTDLVFGQQFGVYAGPVVAEQDFLQVEDYWIHPDFCHECVREPFDFALVELREPVPFSFQLPRIPESARAFRALVQEDAAVTFVGYGTTETGENAEERVILEQRVTSVSESLHEFSAAGSGSACKGDSGGPVFVREGGALHLTGIFARTTSSDCDGTATMRVGSATAAMCWLSEMGVEGDVPDDDFCAPDPDREAGCGSCSAPGPAPTAWFFALWMIPARRPRESRALPAR